MLGQACAHCPIFPTAASRRSLGRVSVPVWLIILSDQLPIIALVGHYPTNKLIRRRLLIRRPLGLWNPASQPGSSCGISRSFPRLSPTQRQIPTRSSPVRHCRGCPQPCDLHVLSMPPAFALSQDQTLRFITKCPQPDQIYQPSYKHPETNRTRILIRQYQTQTT